MSTRSNLVTVKLPNGKRVKNVPRDLPRVELIDKLVTNGVLDTKYLTEADNIAYRKYSYDKAVSDPSSIIDPKLLDQARQYTKPDSVFKEGDSALSNIAKYAGSTGRSALQGLFFGFADELMAPLIAGLTYGASRIAGKDNIGYSDLYKMALDQQRDDLSTIRKESPVTSALSEIGGGVLTGVGAVGAARAVGSAAPRAASAISSFGKAHPIIPSSLIGAAKAVASSAPRVASGISSFGKAHPVISSSLIGAGSGGLYSAGEEEGGLSDKIAAIGPGAALGGLFGAGTAAITPSLVKSGKWALSKVGLKPKPANFYTSRLSKDQIKRSNILEQAGVPKEVQTAGMITRSPKQWQFEQNTKGISGAGEGIGSRYATANKMILNKLDELGVSTGGKSTTQFEAGEKVTDAVLEKTKEMQSEIGRLYSEVRKKYGENVGFKPNSILSTLDEASDNAYADSFVSSVARKMKRYGILNKAEDFMNNVKEDASLNVKNAEELRKYITGFYGDKQVNHLVTKVINSLDDDVIETAGDDFFKGARKAARDRFEEFSTKLVGNISEGKIVSDDIIRKTTYGGKIKDLRKLKDSLFSGTDEQIQRGTQAWNDLKLQSLQSVIDNSTQASGKISGASFKRELKKIGKERLETIFDPSEIDKLKTIEKALEYTTIEVPESVVNYSGTATANANNALDGIIQRSGIGEFISKISRAISRIPLMRTNEMSALGEFGSRRLKDKALQKSVERSLNPFAPIKDVNINPLNTGIAGGLLSE